MRLRGTRECEATVDDGGGEGAPEPDSATNTDRRNVTPLPPAGLTVHLALMERWTFSRNQAFSLQMDYASPVKMSTRKLCQLLSQARKPTGNLSCSGTKSLGFSSSVT